MKAMGKSGWVLGISLVSSIGGIALVFLTLPFGVEAIAWGATATSFIVTIISAIVVGKLINYGLIAQIRDLLPTVLLSAPMTVLVMLIGKLHMSHLFVLILQVSVGALFYILVARITRMDSYFYIVSFGKEKWKRKKDNGNK